MSADNPNTGLDIPFAAQVKTRDGRHGFFVEHIQRDRGLMARLTNGPDDFWEVPADTVTVVAMYGTLTPYMIDHARARFLTIGKIQARKFGADRPGHPAAPVAPWILATGVEMFREGIDFARAKASAHPKIVSPGETLELMEQLVLAYVEDAIASTRRVTALLREGSPERLARDQACNEIEALMKLSKN